MKKALIGVLALVFTISSGIFYLSNSSKLPNLIKKENVCRISISSIGVRSSDTYELIAGEDEFYDMLNAIYELEARPIMFKPKVFNEEYTYLVTIVDDLDETNTLQIIGDYLTMAANQSFKIYSHDFTNILDELKNVSERKQR